MKRFLTTTALVLTTAGAAFAGSHMNADQLRLKVADYLATSPMEVDMMSLTDAQVAELHTAITGTDDASARDAKVSAVLADEGVAVMQRDMEVMIPTPRDQVYTQVKNDLVGTEYEGMAGMLEDEELVQAFAILNSTDSASEKETKLGAVFN